MALLSPLASRIHDDIPLIAVAMVAAVLVEALLRKQEQRKRPIGSWRRSCWFKVFVTVCE